MSLLESEPTTMTPLCDSYADAELEAGLTKLLPFLRAFARSFGRNLEQVLDQFSGGVDQASLWAERQPSISDNVGGRNGNPTGARRCPI